MNHICIDGTVFQAKASKTKKGEDIFSFTLVYYNGKDKDKQATYGSIRVTAFRGLATNAARQLHERDKVKVVGRLIATARSITALEIIKSEPVKVLRPHRIDSKHGYSVDRYKLIGKAMEVLKNDSDAFKG